jgi:hypothetical protein
MIRNDQPFFCGVEVENVFQSLKVSFMTTPLLIRANPSKPFVLEINTSNFALGVILSQPGKNKNFHSVGFHSCKFSPIEINYEIHEKGLLALWMPLKNGVIYFKELNMKSLCILIIRISNIS